MKRAPGSWDLLALVELVMLFNREDPDCLHLHTSKAGTLGALAARISGVSPVVYSSHGHLFHDQLDLQDVGDQKFVRRIFWILRKLTIDLVDRVVALSDYDRDEQIELGLGRSEDFSVIPNGIRCDQYNSVDEATQCEVRREFSLESCDPLLVNVGRLVREKNQAQIIRAVEELRSRGWSSAGCVLLGEGPNRKFLEDLARKRNVEDRVVFAGNRSDVEVFLSLGDIFCFPSLYESQGLAVMEAMTAGLPVVASENGGLTELVHHEETALSVEPKSLDLIVLALERLLETPELADELTRTARKRVIEKYSLQAHVENTLDLYEELLP